MKILFYILLLLTVIRESFRVVIVGFTLDSLLVFVFFGVLALIFLKGSKEEKEAKDRVWRIFSNYLLYSLVFPLFSLLGSLLQLSYVVMFVVEGIYLFALIALFVCLLYEYKKKIVSFKSVILSVLMFPVFLQYVNLILGFITPITSIDTTSRGLYEMLELFNSYQYFPSRDIQ